MTDTPITATVLTADPGEDRSWAVRIYNPVTDRETWEYFDDLPTAFRAQLIHHNACDGQTALYKKTLAGAWVTHPESRP